MGVSKFERWKNVVTVWKVRAMNSATTASNSGLTIQMRRRFLYMVLACLLTAILFLRLTAHGGERAAIQPTSTSPAKQRRFSDTGYNDSLLKGTTPAKRRLFSDKWYNDSLFEESAASKADHIWFLETSGRRKLKPREACSIESACRHNTDYTVHLLYTGNISSNHCPYLRVLSKLPNFRSAAVNAGTELSGTPLSRFYEKGGELRRSKHFVEHLSDFLRYAVIWKRGGIYLDSDIIVLKSLKGIHNSVLFEDKGNTVTNCLLCFTRNHPAIGALMDACSRQYSRDVWTSCSLALMSRLPLDAVFSRRVNFLESWTFCSFFYSNWRYFFDPKMAEQVLKAVNRSYGVHIWNKLSTRTVTVVGSGSAMDRLARAHCPSAYSAAASAGYF